MQAIQFLHTALAQALPNIHARRLTALMCCVSALLQGQCLTLTSLGRFLPGRAYPKHAIKRVDRLLGNPHLRAERPLFYWVMLRALLGNLKHPLILVDWSPIDAPGKFFLLRAAIPLAGRSFPIYERVHEKEGSRDIKNACSRPLPKSFLKIAFRSWWLMPVFVGPGSRLLRPKAGITWAVCETGISIESL
ncbi:hypothetical protein PHLH4_33160 [Pseudomonas sp. St316]|nr:hypothetical protein PHLH4_33160 [Pseudomonas sp. St316]